MGFASMEASISAGSIRAVPDLGLPNLKPLPKLFCVRTFGFVNT